MSNKAKYQQPWNPQKIFVDIPTHIESWEYMRRELDIPFSSGFISAESVKKVSDEVYELYLDVHTNAERVYEEVLDAGGTKNDAVNYFIENSAERDYQRAVFRRPIDEGEKEFSNYQSELWQIVKRRIMAHPEYT